jgi:hypothetical protein
LHRTLKDYIEQPEIWSQICATTPAFSPHASLCKAYALEIKGIDYNISYKYKNNEDTLKEIQRRIPELVADAMYICVLANDRQSKSLIYVLDALDTILTRKFTPKRHLQVTNVPLSPPLMMSLAIRYDLYFWIEELLKRGHRPSLSQPGVPFILIAVDNDDLLELPGMPLDMNWEREGIRHRPSLRCLEVLLSHGADPCEEHEGSTVWSHYVDKFAEILEEPKIIHGYSLIHFEGSENTIFCDWLAVAEIFISHAASISLFRRKVVHLVHRFARCYGDLYGESDDLQRLCQILGVEYESLVIYEGVNANENDFELDHVLEHMSECVGNCMEDYWENWDGKCKEKHVASSVAECVAECVAEGVAECVAECMAECAEECVDKSVDTSENLGYYQLERKRKRTD